MDKNAENYRYVKRQFRNEKAYNLHVKEMIEMIKQEEIKKNLYVKGIKLSNHAYKRMKQHFKVKDMVIATRMVKEMLSKAVRISCIISYEGRINVLYAYNQIAFYLSPDLKTVVTVNRYFKARTPNLNKVHKDIDKNSLIKLYLKHLRRIEEKERVQTAKILDIERRVRESVKACESLLHIGRGGGVRRKREIKALISEQNLHLKQEGWKLFHIKLKKKHICKSLVALY
ncbi:hypothetical protein ABE137_12125 [Brevibacillus laterosporus]|uniref:hypothetical protein n=1 Tax=Brevibacillus laterosporus TaxID=1465 RepID=UPI003D1CFE1D